MYKLITVHISYVNFKSHIFKIIIDDLFTYVVFIKLYINENYFFIFIVNYNVLAHSIITSICFYTVLIVVVLIKMYIT